jgi:hypothetical protein
LIASFRRASARESGVDGEERRGGNIGGGRSDGQGLFRAVSGYLNKRTFRNTEAWLVIPQIELRFPVWLRGLRRDCFADPRQPIDQLIRGITLRVGLGRGIVSMS